MCLLSSVSLTSRRVQFFTINYLQGPVWWPGLHEDHSKTKQKQNIGKYIRNRKKGKKQTLTVTVRRFIAAVWTLYGAVAVSTTSKTQSHTTLEVVVRWTVSCVQTHHSIMLRQCNSLLLCCVYSHSFQAESAKLQCIVQYTRLVCSHHYNK